MKQTRFKMKIKHKLKEINNETVLIKIQDKKEVIAVCPYSAPIAVPGQLQGQIQLLPRLCGNNCALFEVVGNTVLLNCCKLNIQLTIETTLLL
jgi:hypothetical protein